MYSYRMSVYCDFKPQENRLINTLKFGDTWLIEQIQSGVLTTNTNA